MLTDKSGLWLDRPDDHARAAALTLLEHTHAEVLCRCTQQTEDDKRVFRGYYGSGSETAKETATATLVALRWPSGQRAICCFVENKVDPCASPHRRFLFNREQRTRYTYKTKTDAHERLRKRTHANKVGDFSFEKCALQVYSV